MSCFGAPGVQLTETTRIDRRRTQYENVCTTAIALFLTASGLVMEMGGAMSHGAIVARVHAYGGAIEAESLQTAATGGFRLLVDLPLPNQMTDGKEQRG